MINYLIQIEKPIETTLNMPEDQEKTIQQALDLAFQYHTGGDLPKAEGIYQQILKCDANQPIALRLLGLIAHQVGKNDIAFYLISQALAIEPDYDEAYANLGIVLKQLGRTDEAVVSYNKALAIKFDDPETLNNLGNAFNSLGQLDEAITSYKNAISFKPDYVDAHFNLSSTLQKLGQLDEAVASYKKTILLKPNYVEAYINLGLVLKDLGQIDEALASCNKAIMIKPGFAEVYSNLGNILKELGQFDEAVSNYDKALTINPDLAEVHSNMGITLASLGQLDEALASLNRALVIKPDFGEARFSLGTLLYGCCEFKKAMEQFKLTNFGKSKSYLLKCLYELDEQSPFYDQLDDLINQGEFNSVIGSLCSRSEIRYGINRTNPFCNDPLKYVSQIDLTEQCDFNNIFVKTAKNILNDDTISYKSQSLLANGDQTAGNLLLLKIDFIEEIKRILDSEIEKYRLYFKDSEEGFLRHWPKEYNLHGWLISMKSGGELHPHMHEEGWISGSVYINVPSKVKADCGNLIVCIDDEKYATSAKTNSRKSIDVVTGSLCLFPASLLHYTIPFESEEERIVLAFDVIPKTVGQHTKSNN
jgi:tetratricopeptide (TPR) repeat protein